MTTLTFVDNSFNFVREVGDLKSPTCPGMEVEYCTILNHNQFQLKFLHECRGIGMSDRYYYHTVLEVYKNGEFYTDKIADLLWIEMPIDTSDNINKVMKWVYSNA